jgi:hypothetical protein
LFQYLIYSNVYGLNPKTKSLCSNLQTMLIWPAGPVTTKLWSNPLFSPPGQEPSTSPSQYHHKHDQFSRSNGSGSDNVFGLDPSFGDRTILLLLKTRYCGVIICRTHFFIRLLTCHLIFVSLILFEKKLKFELCAKPFVKQAVRIHNTVYSSLY